MKSEFALNFMNELENFLVDKGYIKIEQVIKQTSQNKCILCDTDISDILKNGRGHIPLCREHRIDFLDNDNSVEMSIERLIKRILELKSEIKNRDNLILERLQNISNPDELAEYIKSIVDKSKFKIHNLILKDD